MENNKYVPDDAMFEKGNRSDIDIKRSMLVNIFFSYVTMNNVNVDNIKIQFNTASLKNLIYKRYTDDEVMGLLKSLDFDKILKDLEYSSE